MARTRRNLKSPESPQRSARRPSGHEQVGTAIARRYRELFDRVDADGNGRITAEELQVAMLLEFDVELSTTEVMKMLEVADADGDGEIDFFEFTVLMTELKEGKEACDKDEACTPTDMWRMFAEKVNTRFLQSSEMLQLVLASVQGQVDRDTPAVHVRLQQDKVARGKIVKFATWQTRLTGEVLGLAPFLLPLILMALGLLVLREAQRPWIVDIDKNAVFVGELLLTSGFGILLTMIVIPVLRRKTWGQAIMGTRVVDATTLEDVSTFKFVCKYAVRALALPMTLGIFLLGEVAAVAFGVAELGSSMADRACGTRVVVSVENAP